MSSISFHVFADDESLMKILAKERKEMREIFQRETKRLEKEDRKLQRQNDEQKEEIAKLQQHNYEQKEENEKQSQQMAHQSQEIQQLKEKLRQADLVTKNSLRRKEIFLFEDNAHRIWMTRVKQRSSREVITGWSDTPAQLYICLLSLRSYLRTSDHVPMTVAISFQIMS